MIWGHCFSALLWDVTLRTIKQTTMGWIEWYVSAPDLFWRAYFIGQKNTQYYKKAKFLLVANKQICLGPNAENIKYMLVPVVRE